MDCWFMPSPSASDGGSDNTSVAAAAVWMRTLAGMLLPRCSRRPQLQAKVLK